MSLLALLLPAFLGALGAFALLHPQSAAASVDDHKSSTKGISAPLVGEVTLTATAGSPTGTFTTLKEAFDAINAGTHQGDIVISINANTVEGTTPATLNSTGAGAALYTSVLIRPTIDGISISGNPVTGFGVIQLTVPTMSQLMATTPTPLVSIGT